MALVQWCSGFYPFLLKDNFSIRSTRTCFQYITERGTELHPLNHDAVIFGQPTTRYARTQVGSILSRMIIVVVYLLPYSI